MTRCPGSRGTVLLAVTALLAACSGSAAPTTTEPPTTSASSTTTSIPPTTVVNGGDLWLPPDVCASCSNTVVASIPVGPDGVSYVLEPQPWGPAALAVSPTGGFFVLDALGQGVVRVEGVEMTRSSLADLGLYRLRDLALLDGDLWVLGVTGGPTEIVRAVQVSSRGEMELGIDFPADLHLDATVADLSAGPNGELWVDGAWAAGGSQVAVLRTSPPRLELSWGYPYPNGLWRGRPAPEGTVRFVAGDVEVTLEAAHGNQIGASLLGVNPDGSFVLVVDEVSQDSAGTLHTTIKAVWFDPQGSQLAEATLPLAEQSVYVEHPAALGPDGYVYYLLTRPDAAAILRLAWVPAT
ncbi:MAG: hypothetical protein JW785_01120 [Acidimicrobiia bacterium]|nr:hypothetical protein [Acidimicrobiia bacterium]